MLEISFSCLYRGGGTSIETLYGDVPPKWVGFWQKIPKHGSHFDPQIPKRGSIFIFVKIAKIPKHGSIFWAKSLNMGPILTPKSLNMGPFFVKIAKIPKRGSIFWAKSLNMGTFFTSKHGLGSRGPGGTPPSKPKSSTPPGFIQGESKKCNSN